MLKILQHFWSFIIYPSDRQLFAKNNDTYAKVFFTMFLFKVLILSIILPLQYLLQQIDPIFTKKMPHDESFWQDLLAVGLLAPLIEELLFRYFLKYKPFFSYVINRNTWRKNYRWFLYSSVALYGLAHLSNFENANTLFYVLGVFIVLSNFMDGFVFSFLRVRLGFQYNWMLYGIWNVFTIALISTNYQLRNPILNEKNENYQLEVNLTQYRDTTENLFFIRKSADTIYNINVKQHALSTVVDSLCGKNTYNVYDQFVDIDFRSPKGLAKDSLLRILTKKLTIEEKKTSD